MVQLGFATLSACVTASALRSSTGGMPWNGYGRLHISALRRIAWATAWVAAQKQRLAHSDLRQVMRNIRQLFPREHALPEPVRKAIAYFFHNRTRMRYKQFRQAGYPIGSGSVESACKRVIQARLKQAGMRWSRSGAKPSLPFALFCSVIAGVTLPPFSVSLDPQIFGTHPDKLPRKLVCSCGVRTDFPYSQRSLQPHDLARLWVRLASTFLSG